MIILLVLLICFRPCSWHLFS